MDKSVKVSSVLYNKLVELANKEGRKIKFVLDKAIENYLKVKKVLEN